MNTMLLLVRREFWEHRSLWIAPLVWAGIIVILSAWLFFVIIPRHAPVNTPVSLTLPMIFMTWVLAPRVRALFLGPMPTVWADGRPLPFRPDGAPAGTATTHDFPSLVAADRSRLPPSDVPRALHEVLYPVEKPALLQHTTAR